MCNANVSRFDFDRNNTGFSLMNAYGLCLAAKVSYQKKEDIQRTVFEDWKLDRLKFISSKTGAQLFVAGNDSITIIAFRGTDSLEDWKINFNFPLKRFDFGKVHKDFNHLPNQVPQFVIALNQQVHCFAFLVNRGFFSR